MANTTIKGKHYETTLIDDSDSVIKLGKKALVFYGGEIDVADPSTLAGLGYGIVEDLATSPDIGGNTYKIGGRVVGLTGAVTTFGDNTRIAIGKTADLSAGLGIGLGSVLGGDLAGLSIGTVFAGGDNSKITIAKGADIGGLIGVTTFGANSSISNSGNIHTGLLGMLAGDLSALLGGVVVGAAALDAEPLPSAKLVNNGSIESAVGIIGVLTDGMLIENGPKGNITAGVIGIGSFTMDGMEATINNSGTIRVTLSLTIPAELGLPLSVASVAIFGFDGVEHVNNTGKIFGGVILGGGNDVFNNVGGAVHGLIMGGLGDDTLIVGKATDVLVELDGEGTDTIQSAFTYVLTDFVDNLVLTGKKAINATGNALDNRLQGNGNNNVLTGEDGADTFVFGTGDRKDTIADFDVGEGDMIEVAGWGFEDFGALSAKAEDVDGDVVITLGKDVLTIKDHVLADLSASFAFIA